MTTTVRVPLKLKQAADRLVSVGYYKNFSDVVVSGLRHEVLGERLTFAVREAREAKKAVWEEELRKAGGDPKKAIKLMGKEDEKMYKEDPGFWRL